MSFKDELEKILRFLKSGANAEIEKDIDQALTSIINLVDKEVEAARKEEWAKLHTKYQKGTVKGQYTILEAVRRVGKNTKFRVECLNCHGVMFRYANKFKLPHKNCVNNDMRNKLRDGE